VVHVGVFLERFAWSLPIVKTPTPNSQLRHARQLNHAQIRRAGKPPCDRDQTCAVGRAESAQFFRYLAPSARLPVEVDHDDGGDLIDTIPERPHPTARE